MTRRHLRLLPLFIGGPLFVLPMIEEAQPLEKKAEGQRRSTKKTEEKEEEVLNEVWEEQKQEQNYIFNPPVLRQFRNADGNCRNSLMANATSPVKNGWLHVCATITRHFKCNLKRKRCQKTVALKKAW